MARIPLAVLLLWLLAPGAATAAPGELIVYAASRCDQQGDLGPNVPTFDGSPRSCDSELWTVRPDGTDDRQLTFNGVADSDPAWSPDGLRLAVARGVPEDHGFTRIHVIGADGSGSTQISHGFDANGVSTSDGGPSWSPLGDRVAFSAGFPGDLFTVGADGRGQLRISDDPRHELRPTFSPEGARVAFTRYASRDDNAVGLGQAGIWILPSVGGVALPVTSGDVPVDFMQFGFSPDCTRIAFATGDRVHTVSTLGGPVEALGPAGSREPDFSPDGDRLVYTAVTAGEGGRQVSNLFVLDITRPAAPPVQITRIAEGSGAYTPDWAPNGAFAPLCRRADALAPVVELIGGGARPSRAAAPARAAIGRSPTPAAARPGSRPALPRGRPLRHPLAGGGVRPPRREAAPGLASDPQRARLAPARTQAAGGRLHRAGSCARRAREPHA